MNRDDKMNKLVLTLQAMAQPADIQTSLFPDSVIKTDEFRLDFYDALLLLKSKICPPMPP